jgi:hypothetical protein
VINNSGRAVIVCSNGASLEFSDIIQLQIIGIEFIWCRVKVDIVSRFILENSLFHGGINSSALHLNHSFASITGSSFVSNTAGTY